MTTAKLNSLSKTDIEAMNWYYKVELKPGAYTSARIRPTSSMTRKVVRHIDLKGKSCLDIGAQECLLTAMIARQGAKKVVAYDRLNLSERIELLKEAYDVDFDYYHSLQLNELPARFEAENVQPFDVVVFAGVLYHMIDPLAGLATARSFLREGGLFVIETSVIATGDYTAEFNAKGRFYPGSNYFQISLGTLDYFLRMLRLEPIDLLFTKPGKNKVCRVTIVARAVNHVVATDDDTWLSNGPWFEKDMQSAHLYYDRLQSNKPAVTYKPENDKLRFFKGTEVVDVWSTFKASKHHKVQVTDGQLNLTDHS